MLSTFIDIFKGNVEQFGWTRYPPGYISLFDNSGNDSGPGWDWASMILPELEQAPLQNNTNFSLPIEAPGNTAVRLTSDGPPNAPGTECNEFSSLHPGGAHFLFADGHVQLISTTINLAIFKALSTRAGDG